MWFEVMDCDKDRLELTQTLQICILGMGCEVVTWMEHFRQPAYRPWRSAMFVGLGTSGIVPVMHGIQIYGWQGMEDRMGLTWVLLQGFLYIFGAFIYVVSFHEVLFDRTLYRFADNAKARWPERISPVTFDIWGSSHQLFHFCVLLAAASHFYGIVKAFDHHHAIMGAQCS